MSSKGRGVGRGSGRGTGRGAGRGIRGQVGVQAKAIEDLGADAIVTTDLGVDEILRALEKVGTLMGRQAQEQAATIA
ncbi:hypothetical protein NL676_034503 [Syzygium grande]|nr:hypothetical protein NL676_034503 [Syzygium grande]